MNRLCVYACVCEYVTILILNCRFRIIVELKIKIHFGHFFSGVLNAVCACMSIPLELGFCFDNVLYGFNVPLLLLLFLFYIHFDYFILLVNVFIFVCNSLE